MLPFQTEIHLGKDTDTSALRQNIVDLHPAIHTIRGHYHKRTMPHFILPEAREDLATAAPIVKQFREFKDVIILGTGGSSLGGKSLYQLADAGFGPARGNPRLHFMDNVDPHTFTQLQAALDPKTTGIIAISKSGSTAETLCQLFSLLPHYKSDHLLFITEPTGNSLRP
jgi:glucose-6-phosphate isomerase